MRKLLVLVLVLAATAGVRAQSATPKARVAALLSSRGPAAGTYGVSIIDASSGEVLIGHDALSPRVPASTLKVVTTGASLMALGLDSPFRTVAYAAAKPVPGGNLAGDLVILGGGDPSLDVTRGEGEPGSIDRLARAIARAGVKRVAGDLVLDDSRFDPILRAPGWPENQLTRSYCAPVSALTVGRGCLTVVTRPGRAAGEPGRVSIIPAARSISITNRVVTTTQKKNHLINLSLPLSGRKLTVTGRVWLKSTGYPAEVAAPDPTHLMGEALRNRLVAHGVSVSGGIVSRPGAVGALATKVELAAVEAVHRDLIKVTNRESQNFFAECLFKNLGYLMPRPEGGVPAPRRGSFARGGKATAALASTLGFPEGHLVQIDGSGLSRDNRVTPYFMAKFLHHLYGRDDWKEYVQSFPHGGQAETTMRRRLKDLGTNVFAKTGTINSVSGLAGYVRSKSGRVLAFAMLMNDRKTPLSRCRELQDAICRVLFEGY